MPVRTPAASPGWSANASKRDRRVSGVEHVAANRCANGARPVLTEKHQSPSASRSSAARSSANRRARSMSAAGVFADSVSTWPRPLAPLARAGAGAAPPRATTCALVPLNPNELTPATRRPSARGHGVARRRHVDRQLVPRRCAGSARRSAGAAGSRRAASASTTLISPAMPAAASRWPMFVFTEPIEQRVVGARRPAEDARRAPATSIGSPSGVPVPCAST